MTKWISVKNELPESGEWVLVAFPRLFEQDHNELTIGINIHSDIHGWELKTTDSYVQGITHWQPLPFPPGEQDE